MNGSELQVIGRALFGDDYTHERFARSLGISRRAVRRMIDGTEAIPEGLATDAETLLRIARGKACKPSQ